MFCHCKKAVADEAIPRRIASSFLLAMTALAIFLPSVVFAAPNDALLSVYSSRADLRKAFDRADSYQAAGPGAGFLIDLEDWARQYGWRDYKSLSAYAPASTPPAQVGHAAPPRTTASSYVVIDKSSGIVLAASHADTVWPIASLTKLMTSQIVLDSGTQLTKVFPVKTEDDVGGAKLYVSNGDTFTLDGLLYATLVGSANNAANAITRATGKSKPDFVREMNERAATLNLGRTKYVDPTGIETGNVSTARELALVAGNAFSRPDIKRYTTTAKASISVLSQGAVKTIKNTNWMLWKPQYDHVFVTGGKTGYLVESGWNLAVALRPSAKNEKRELLVVLFGAESRAASFEDADALSSWAWKNFK